MRIKLYYTDIFLMILLVSILGCGNKDKMIESQDDSPVESTVNSRQPRSVMVGTVREDRARLTENFRLSPESYLNSSLTEEFTSIGFRNVELTSLTIDKLGPQYYIGVYANARENELQNVNASLFFNLLRIEESLYLTDTISSKINCKATQCAECKITKDEREEEKCYCSKGGFNCEAEKTSVSASNRGIIAYVREMGGRQ